MIKVVCDNCGCDILNGHFEYRIQLSDPGLMCDTFYKTGDICSSCETKLQDILRDFLKVAKNVHKM